MLLDVAIPTLEARLALRTSHPTLADAATAMRVLADMRRQLSPPTPEGGEGFDRIYTLPESAQPAEGDWSAADIDRVLQMLERDGQPETVPRKPVAPPQRFAPRGGFDSPHRGGGYRGRGDFGGAGRGGYRGYEDRGGRGGYAPRPPAFRPYPPPPTVPGYGAQQNANPRAPVYAAPTQAMSPAQHQVPP